MDSYRVEKNAVMKIALADKDAEIEPVPTDAHGHKPEPELDPEGAVMLWVELWVGIFAAIPSNSLKRMAGTTGLEPAASAVTVRRH